MSENIFKSPRQIAEEVRQYKLERFERYMQMADDEILSRELAITAFTEELESNVWVQGVEVE